MRYTRRTRNTPKVASIPADGVTCLIQPPPDGVRRLTLALSKSSRPAITSVGAATSPRRSVHRFPAVEQLTAGEGQSLGARPRPPVTVCKLAGQDPPSRAGGVRVADAPEHREPFWRFSTQPADIARYVERVEPLLRRGSTLELGGRRPVGELADVIEDLVRRPTSRH